MLYKSLLIEQFKDLGLKAGDIILLHASMAPTAKAVENGISC